MKAWLLKNLPEILLIAGAAMARLIPHPPNFTPIGALALVGGFVWSRKKSSLLAPVIALALSDLFLGVHSTMPAVYLSFMLIVALGAALKNQRALNFVLAGPAVSAVLFFLVTNFAVWAQGSYYPLTAQGLVACFVAAVPFFGNTLAGDYIFTAALVAAYTGLTKVHAAYLQPQGAAQA